MNYETIPKASAVDCASIQVAYGPALRNAADRVTKLLKARLWQASLDGRLISALAQLKGKGPGFPLPICAASMASAMRLSTIMFCCKRCI